ncbi:MAG TPA: ATP-binding cassette domain-containing protein [Methylomirabilota bacterium]|nr:ATP-binding cassette domain-containing protein [Methylomirabilota bacterium]
MTNIPSSGDYALQAVDLSVRAGAKRLLASVNYNVPRTGAHGIIGPSGAGKSTLLRCLNRLIDLTPGLEVSGDVRFNGSSIYHSGVDVDAVRERIGMLFQQPVIFPQSISKNVLFGAGRLRKLSAAAREELLEQSLREAALWAELKDRLHEPAAHLSVGQQQRLCLARALAMKPEVLLMDEPTSALDPKATAAIEELILELSKTRPVALVTHNLRQAERVCSTVFELQPTLD